MHTHYRCYVCTTLGQIGVGSPDLYTSLPLHLQRQTLGIISDMLENIPPAVIRQYEDKKTLVWGTFIPFMQLLYKPSTNIKQDTKGKPEINDAEDFKHNFHISCCNALLHGLENALGRELHLEVLLKEGLLDYTMCLPAVLPGECQPRARSLVNELGKHRQLQPPSLCTLAKAHIAKTFCGLQPVMEMTSIGEFAHKHF